MISELRPSLPSIDFGNLEETREVVGDAVVECAQYSEDTIGRLTNCGLYRTEPELLVADSLGAWALERLLGHTPEYECELHLTRRIGCAAISGFRDWFRE
jgi:hypothetical protein